MARLSREERRAQLVARGMQIVADQSFDALSVDDVAADVGISRSLLFHYFPTKRDFLVAIAAAAADELLEVTSPNEALPALERLRDSLGRYLDHVENRRDAYLALVRGAAGGDPEMRAVFDRTRAAMAGRLLEGLGLGWAGAPPALRVAARGWVAFVEEITVTWLGGEPIAREDVVALAEQVIRDVVLAVLGIDLEGEAAQVSLSSSPSGL